MYRSSCLIGLFMTISSSFAGINFIIFYELFVVITGGVSWLFGLLLSFRKDEIGRDCIFFSKNCLPDNFYIRFCVFLSYICMFLFIVVAVCGLLLSIAKFTNRWWFGIYALYVIDFEDCCLLKLFPVCDMSRNALFDSLSYPREPFLESALEVGRLTPNLSADGALLRPRMGSLSFSSIFYYFSLSYWGGMPNF